MAIYGDEKHNENMEHKPLQYVVTDKTVYRTTHWRVETDNDTYFVQCQEGDMYDTWSVESKEGEPIDTESQLGQDLITTCEIYEDWNMDSDEIDKDDLSKTAVPTNGHVWRYGSVVAHWPCDVGADKEIRSNGSIENVVEYEGRHYSVVTDWDGNVRWKDEMAGEMEWNDESQDDYEHFFNDEAK